MSIVPFEPSQINQTWGEELLVARVPGVATAKILKRHEGEGWYRAGLQYHERKHECFYLLSGEVYVFYVHSDRLLHRVYMRPGMAFIIPPGVAHSVQTLTDSVMVEASNDVANDRVRVEDQYDITRFVDDDAK